MALGLICACGLAGCGALTRTSYVRPTLQVPSGWHATDGGGQTPTQLTQSDDAWWRVFNDSALNTLIERAMAGNQDLATAVLNLRRARQEIDLSRANALPVPALAVGYSGSRTLKGAPATSHSSSLSASVSYEVDLWGSLASATDAARWEAHASEQDWRTAKISVAAAVASAYWQLAWLSEQIDQNADAVRYAEQSLAYARERYRAGAIDAIDRLAAEQSLASERAGRTTLLSQQTEASTALALLLGEPPDEHFEVPATRLLQPVPQVAAGVPADILSRRPDVQAAEMRVRESLDQVDASRTSFYPALSLTGSAGTASDALRNLLQNPVGSLAASLSAPFLDFWSMRATVGLVQTSYEEAVVAFRKTFYQALTDVENALAARAYYDEQIAQQQIVLDTARQGEQRYAAQYDAGYIPLQTLLDAQQRTRDANAELAAVRYSRLVNQGALYQALGAGR